MRKRMTYFNVCCSSSWWTPCLHQILEIFSVGPTSSTTMQTSAWSTPTTSRHQCSWRPYVTHTQTHTRRNANTQRWFDNIIVYIHHRRLSRQWCSGPHYLASGPWLSAAPRGQRSTPGLTDASTTTWSSSRRVWSAPAAHTTPLALPSKSCMIGFHNTIC